MHQLRVLALTVVVAGAAPTQASDDVLERILAVAPALDVGPGGDIALGHPGGGTIFAAVDPGPLAALPGFALTEALYDNYALTAGDPEDFAPAERAEEATLIAHLLTTPQIAVARAHLQARADRTLDDAAMARLIRAVWFAPYALGRTRDLTGFEHVFVGEADASRVGGLHFWHRYWRLEAAGRTEILRDRRSRAEARTPSVTIAYVWRTADGGTLEKPIGSFLVGATPATLVAIGLVHRATDGDGGAPVTIDGVPFRVVVHRAPDGIAVRTLYFDAER